MINLTANGKLKVLRDAIEERQEHIKEWQEKVSDLDRKIAKLLVLAEACQFAGIEYADTEVLTEEKEELTGYLGSIEQAEKEIEAFEQYQAQIRSQK